MDDSGILAMVGGGEWSQGASFDSDLLAKSDGEVLVLPTAAAYERPDRAITTATDWFDSLGGMVTTCMILSREDASDPKCIDQIESARFIYIASGSPLHLRSVLKDSTALAALVASWRAGATIAGSGAGAMVLTDPMVDPRGGAFTVGFGLVRGLCVMPHFDATMSPQFSRTLAMAPTGCAVVGLPERTAVIREPNGAWRLAGEGAADAVVFLDGAVADLAALAGKPIGP